MPRSLAWRGVRALLAVAFAGAVVVAAFLLRLTAGPIRLAFLDAAIVRAVRDAAPEVSATIERTELARAGQGIAIRVSGVRLARRDGTPLASLPAVTVRPSLRALLRGRVIITRVGIADATIALTRTADGTWHVGGGDGGAGAVVSDVLAAPSPGPRGAHALPQILLTRARVTVDDQRAGLQIALTDGELALSPGTEAIEVTLGGVVGLESIRGPVRGRLHLPVQITATVAHGEGGALGRVAFTVTGSAGELALAGAGATPDALAGLAAAGTYVPDADTIRVERLTARLGASTLDGTMTAILSDAPSLALDGEVDALALTDLARLWPSEAAATVRTWLAEHTKVGVLRRCRVQLGAPPADGGAPSAPPREAYDVACDFEGVTAHYLPPMAPIRAAVGSARLTAERLTVDVASGTVGACRVENGKLTMDLTTDPPRARIAVDVAGAAADVLALVDGPPLQLVTPLGITPKDFAGESRVHATLTLPIKRALAAREVGVQANATFTGAGLPIAAGIGLENGVLTVQTDGRSLTVQGTTGVTGLPEIPGPVAMTLTAAPGTAAATQTVALALDGDGVGARGTATIAGRTLAALSVERLRLGGHDLAGTLRRRADGGYDATLAGARLDLAALLADRRLWGNGNGAFAAPTNLTVSLQHVQLAADVAVADVRGELRTVGGVLDAAALSGTVVPGGAFEATLARQPEFDAAGRARRLVVTSKDGGRLLGALGIPTEIEGGTLKLTATTDQRGAPAYLAGELTLHDVRVVHAPILARILTVGSLHGIAALVQRRDGLLFHEAKVPFRWEAPTLVLQEVRAVGAIGLTADGIVTVGGDGPNARFAGRCDVRGNVIPAYTLNTALGRIPLIDKVPLIRGIVGGKDRGLFGITYEVKGALPDPAVRVNPLTAVTPTVLRTWFVDPFTRRAAGTNGAGHRGP